MRNTLQNEELTRMNLHIINPIQNSNWDKIVLGMDNHTFFHSSFWAKVLVDAYRYKPFYFVLKNGSTPLAALACMEVSSVFTGRRSVCLPFSDFCPPLFSDMKCLRSLFHEVFQWGKDRGWKYIEWRAGESVMEDQVPYQSFLGHRLSLKGGEDRLLGLLRSSTRRNVQKAVREGVQVHVSQTKEAMQTFYDLNCITRRNHGLPPQPKNFFSKVYDHIISKKNGYVVLAFHDNNPIAASIYVHFGQKAFFKYGASDKRFHHLRPNNLVMFEAIKLYADQGYHTLDLGRTDLKNKGLLQFKRGWGATEYPIHYYRYNLAHGIFENKAHASSNYKLIIRKLPIPVLKLAGKILYRHFG